jgi:cell division septation protein DedD
MVTFQLHRKGVVLLIVGCVLVGVLLFAGGYLAGMRRASASAAPAVPAVALPKVPKVPAVQASAATTPPREPEHFAIRAGLFTSSEEATAYLQQLTARKLAASLGPMTTSSGAKLYAVRLGDYPTRRAAATAADALHRDHGIDGVIVSLQMEPMVAQTTT